MRRHKRGAMGLMHKFNALFRRPLSRIFAPTLGIASLLTIIFAPDSNGFSVMTDIAAACGLPPYGQKGEFNVAALQNLPGHMVNGLTAATPLIIGTVITGILGRIFKL